MPQTLLGVGGGHHPQGLAPRGAVLLPLRQGQGEDGHQWHDEDGWHDEAPRLDRHAGRLTLALPEDLSHLLGVHGYEPLRGVALATRCRTLVHLPYRR